jgi:hypothetical protein
VGGRVGRVSTMAVFYPYFRSPLVEFASKGSHGASHPEPSVEEQELP